MIKHNIKRALKSAGLEIRRYRLSSADLLEKLLRAYAVDTILDIGANTGQSGLLFRELGFAGKIVSFEPVGHLFARLENTAEADASWHVERCALGRAAGVAEIHVSGGHAGASSILEMTDNVRIHAPDQRVIGKETVPVTTLEDALGRHYPAGRRCFLKLDVQGYEKSVLDGGLDALSRVVGMKIEMSLVENYKGETLLFEMLPFLNRLGFRPVSFENGWANPESHELYQVDCILFRTRASEGVA